MWRYLLTILLITSACSTPPATENAETPPIQDSPVSESSVDATSGLAVNDHEPILLTASEGNLIPNAGAEVAENAAQPSSWSADSWGNNTSNLSWESSDPFSGEKYLSVTVANYVDGDAKWVFEPQNLKSDTWYEYSDYYRSDGRSRLIESCTTPDGKRKFSTVWQADKAQDWKKVSYRFYVSATSQCQTTIMHIMDHNGYLHTDHHQLREVEPLSLKQPMVSVTFDDIYASSVDIGATELEKRGWKGSYYVAGKFARLPDAPKYAHVEKIKDLISRGHELGSHSNTHPFLSLLNANDVIFQIQSNYDYLKFLGQAPEGLAYPYGDFSAAVETETKRFHEYARTSLVGLNDQSLDTYRLRILPVTNQTTTLELFNWIDDAERTSTWLILLFHELSEGLSEDPYATDITQYQQVLSYLGKQKDMLVLPVNQGLQHLK